MIPLLALVLGVVAGLLLGPTAPDWLDPYLPVAVVAAVDAALGAARSRVEGTFDDREFIVSFVSNVVIAVLLVLLGDLIGFGGALSTAVVVVLGIRIFTTATVLRRALIRI
ncbi:small basic family protein [Frankia tisae]|uniref:small basic family protein n=1 Tax=Frankia tisae TaxID=2950104 RepID=UPI0021BE7088|nr:small basic family protein [Frankia tisae]